MKKSALIVGIIALSTAACGGGNGDDDDTPNLAGIWRGSVTVFENTCSLPVTGNSFSFTHAVNQNESAVVLDDENGRHFLGNVVGADGLSVDASSTQSFFPGNVVCNFGRRIEYDGVSGEEGDSNENTADSVIITDNGTCAGPGNCRISFRGTASRNSAPLPTPTVTPGTTPTATPTPGTGPAKGPCNQVLERPFIGDAACGLSNVSVDQTASGFSLEPFGANGLTNFTSTTVDATMLTTVRNDLTIKGETGYTCSVECFPTSTFTITCSKEGGTSCKEKF